MAELLAIPFFIAALVVGLFPVYIAWCHDVAARREYDCQRAARLASKGGGGR